MKIRPLYILIILLFIFSCKQTYYYRVSNNSGIYRIKYGETSNKANSDSLDLIFAKTKPKIRLQKNSITTCYYTYNVSGNRCLMIIKIKLSLVNGKIESTNVCTDIIENPASYKCKCNKRNDEINIPIWTTEQKTN